MRYATAIGHLRLVAEACAEWASRSVLGDASGPYVVAAYAFGDILDAPEEPDISDVVFVVDEGVETLPWGIEPPAVRAFVDLSRIDRHPIRWLVQPRDVPVGHHRIVRPVRLWDVDHGIDEVAIEALRQRRPEDVRLPAPDEEEARAALERHLAVTRAALDAAIERFWDANWRREHKGAGRYPEQTLWELAWGVRDLERAVDGKR
ncbi:MAG: hypothetical protein KG028_02710 [Actinobacteria bacterium]|jgi:hypothetical protein|nr:hypothetical protein [Actinomycetota bacterium]